jgi:tetratricopeptide (TPR) repeat protein
LEQEREVVVAHSSADTIDWLKNVAETHRRLGNLERARELYDSAFKISVKASNWQMAAWCLWGKAISMRGSAQAAETIRLFSNARDLGRTAGDRRCVAWASAQLAEVQRIVGFRAKAFRKHQDMFEEFRLIRDLKGMSWALNGIGQIFWAERQLPQARDAFLRATDVSILDEDSIGQGWALRGLAEVALHAGNWQEADIFSQRAIAEFESKGYHVGIGYALRTRATVECASGSIDRAQVALAKAEGEFELCAELRGLGYLNLTRAAVCRKSGEMDMSRLASERASRYLLQAGVRNPVGLSAKAIGY